MDMEHGEWSVAIQTPEKQLLGTCAYVLLLSHYIRALKSRKNEARRVVCQVEHQILLVERKVVSLIPEQAVYFHIFNPAIMIVSDACFFQ